MSFTAVNEDSSQRLYGPRALLVCGYTTQEQNQFLDLIKRMELERTAVIFADQESMKWPLHEIFGQKHCHKLGSTSAIPRAIIISGVTENELFSIMRSWKTLALPSQLWATLTPHSESWLLEDLLIELNNERKAMARRKGNGPSQ
jgi:hypothetical protein